MIENIRLRVSPEEKAELRAAAVDRGLTLSEYIREASEEQRRLVEFAQQQGLTLSEFLRRSGVGVVGTGRKSGAA
ncbi:hypothetical protein [Mesorhizobium sp. M0589]|uniref:plasmid mobilization protein n=1 Tax=Mesorhizobium sp. M0589 TaxID=2956965 RepID=UPI00333D97A8